ncbi:unnamed protein product [Leptidea sinapis]|uniref:Uncharacterized protein n=1 Tax=Leptidea sinapis TaxID=189913 RepID=A0A5E4QY46_9NEOP|nr:unnamed protein product [Leptidea sinapis]
MKRVRFESPLKDINRNIMINDSESHSPRQFIGKQINSAPTLDHPEYGRVLSYSTDPVRRYEYGNSSPYPTLEKSYAPKFSAIAHPKLPSNDLDLSMLDISNVAPHKHNFSSIAKKCDEVSENCQKRSTTARENNKYSNGTISENDFFLRKENLKTIGALSSIGDIRKLTLDKENNPIIRKKELAQLGHLSHLNNAFNYHQETLKTSESLHEYCKCHHCSSTSTPYNEQQCLVPSLKLTPIINEQQCCCMIQKSRMCPHHLNASPIKVPCQCQVQNPKSSPINATDKKTWAIEKYENKKSDNTEVVGQNTVTKERREPTVADLFKIIKLQNEQLQLLQEKVDKFIENSNKKEVDSRLPIQNGVDNFTVQAVGNQQHKMSIGVMTSFEMVCTSTVINKEVIKKCEAQIQCNRSQISIKEVSKAQPVNINFLEGIQKNGESEPEIVNDMTRNTNIDDKTLNELSLYNLHVDNATTPLMSPDQTLYLDVKDYSDSDSGSDDPSNVGWTYYNKVMNPVEIPQAPTTTTDTSLKMNQLAAKYLKTNQDGLTLTNVPAQPTDLSFATKNYMERHKILQGKTAAPQKVQQDMPKFLDITVLKQQPKFL